jgi:hypothetical protein
MKLQIIKLVFIFLSLSSVRCSSPMTTNDSSLVAFSRQGHNKAESSLRWFQADPKAVAVWASFGTTLPQSKTLASWVRKAKQGQELPQFRNTLSLNCWEYVLYTALKTSKITLEETKSVYAAKASGQKLSEVLGKTIGNATYTIEGSQIKIAWPSGIKPGDVVFMDETSHVVQLIGEQGEQGHNLVASFSPRPIWGDGSQERPVEGTRPELTTIESLIEEMMNLSPDVPTDWQKIDLKIVRFSEKESL